MSDNLNVANKLQLASSFLTTMYNLMQAEFEKDGTCKIIVKPEDLSNLKHIINALQYNEEDKYDTLLKDYENLAKETEYLRDVHNILSTKSLELQKEVEKLKKENTNYYYEVHGIMHSVEKWLDKDEMNLTNVEKSAKVREKLLQALKDLGNENATIRQHFLKLCDAITERAVNAETKVNRLKTALNNTLKAYLGSDYDDVLTQDQINEYLSYGGNKNEKEI